MMIETHNKCAVIFRHHGHHSASYLIFYLSSKQHLKLWIVGWSGQPPSSETHGWSRVAPPLPHSWLRIVPFSITPRLITHRSFLYHPTVDYTSFLSPSPHRWLRVVLLSITPPLITRRSFLHHPNVDYASFLSPSPGDVVSHHSLMTV
jgi:hypothetical protein